MTNYKKRRISNLKVIYFPINDILMPRLFCIVSRKTDVIFHHLFASRLNKNYNYTLPFHPMPFSQHNIYERRKKLNEGQQQWTFASCV